MVPAHLREYLKKLDLKRDRWEYSFEFVYVLLILYQVYLIANYWNQLPDIIPTHFNAHGHPDGYGAKSTLLIFPGISMFLYALMFIVYKFPQAINIPWKLTEQNLERQIKLVWRLMLIIKGEILVMMTYFCYGTIYVALGYSKSIGYSPEILVGAILITALWYFIKGYTSR